jgi:hypothetical protein
LLRGFDRSGLVVEVKAASAPGRCEHASSVPQDHRGDQAPHVQLRKAGIATKLPHLSKARHRGQGNICLGYSSKQTLRNAGK